MAEVAVPVDMTPDLGVSEITVTSDGLEGGNGTNFESVPVGESSPAVVSIVDEVMAKVSTDVIDVDMKPSIKDDLPTPKKKFRENDGDEPQMEIDFENKENILSSIRSLSRKELEDLILVKIVEALMKHSDAGKYRTKLAEMQQQRDKMQNRVTHLQKQVVEMGKAMKVLLDNQSRDPNNLIANKKRPPPIKFYRSVGLQVIIEPAFKNGPTKIVHVNNTNAVPLNGMTLMKTLNNSSPVLNKRPGPKSLTDPRAMKMANGGILSKQMNGHHHVTNPTRVATTTLVAAPRQQLGSTPTVVDLTDDNMSEGSSGNVVHCKVVKPGQKGAPAGGYLISAGGQNRAVVARPTSTPSNSVTVVRPGNSSAATPTAGRSSLQNSSATNTNVKKIALPPMPSSSAVTVPRGVVLKEVPPKPTLTLSEQVDGIVLSWTMKLAGQHAEIASYQIYACQESLASQSLAGKTSTWKKVGDVKALPLPMACTLSQFTQGNRYFFIVRAVDQHGRSGPFCDPGPIILQKKKAD